MAKFKYVGDPNDRFSGPDVANHYGYTFPKGEVVEVSDKTDADKENIRKLQGNSHFIDVSDKDAAKDVAERQKALDKAEKDRAKAEDEQRKQDEADEEQRQKNLAKAAKANKGGQTAANAPRPPGTVTRENANDPFGGRPVEERTPAEDHTKAGKTKS